LLAYLLDEHLSPRIAAELTARRPEIPVVAMRAWHGGAYLGADDPTILAAAHAESRALVTFDLRTMSPLLREWSEAGRPHGGVVFVHPRTFAAHDIGGIILALVQLWEATRYLDWTDRVVFLQR
jgi:hypothetical protein